MTKLTFYRQVRQDGGIRTGVEINGELVLGRFEQDVDEEDPVLDWFVDIRCLVNKLPNDPEVACQWFLDHAQLI